ncbi:multifunctional pyrimidine synthesis protein CAD [Moesziomyces antarcticus T-34]|uniref:Carbamoyl phosphate synthase arginine-specific small chain n=1 Tax=Pseudozyma antarctica (strain T-34) TaxID=1151754 RepID=M9LJR9_PSEA3|nr:multifunctional pyrimidine synthesis protein CAD [Moesziomyces antarcticus T-34]
MLAPLRNMALQRSTVSPLIGRAAIRSLATHASVPITYTEAPASKLATLHLKSGHSFTGRSFGAPRSVFGETVFTTSITSYTESLTDPSYQGQILTFTQPLMGNYGVPDNSNGQSPIEHPADVDVGAFLESNKVQAAGVIVSNLAERFSHYLAKESLATWCARHNVPGLFGVDTRAITSLLRDQGSTLGAILVGDGHDKAPALTDYVDPMAENLIAKVSTKEPYVLHPVGGAEAARCHVALMDFGCKANILRSLLRRGASVTVLPWDFDFNKVRDGFDGLFLSNGPGSPYSIEPALNMARAAVSEWDRPIFGICMGHQVIGIAAGVEAYRMKFGNRGHNQPVVALKSAGDFVKRGRVYITSQNHGYALTPDESKWPEGWQPWFVNANDSSVEGIIRTELSEQRAMVWGVQFHPEHCGGPEDTNGIFEDFVEEVVRIKGRQGRSQAGKGLPEDMPVKQGAPAFPINDFGVVGQPSAHL